MVAPSRPPKDGVGCQRGAPGADPWLNESRSVVVTRPFKGNGLDLLACTNLAQVSRKPFWGSTCVETPVGLRLP